MSRTNQTLIANRYQNVRLLGEERLGAVDLAEDPWLGGKTVAVKASFDNSSVSAALSGKRAEAHGELHRARILDPNHKDALELLAKNPDWRYLCPEN